MEINVSSQEVKIKPNAIFKGIGIVAIIMACTVIYELFPLDFEDNYSFDTFIDVFGIVFLILWITVVLSLGCAAFITGNKTVTINDAGVVCRSPWFKNELTWAEIKDYGVSYCGQTRGLGNAYVLYFAPEEQKNKNECKKKLKGKMIRFYVTGDAYSDVINKAFPFCTNFTKIIPFIAEDRFHLF